MAVTSLGLVPFEVPIKATVGDKVYAIRGYSEIPASNALWGEAETERDFENTPWARDGNSATLASQFTEYAFLANPAFWEGTPPPGATYDLPGPEPTTTQGLLYYLGDGQLHYTRGTGAGGAAENQKVVFYIGADVNFYVKHDDDNEPVVPQPPFNEEQSPLPGSGWTVVEYRDYNAEYVRHTDDNQVGIVSAYVRHTDDGQVAPTPEPYQRHDDDNNPIT